MGEKRVRSNESHAVTYWIHQKTVTGQVGSAVKFAEVYFTKRHTWNYSSLPDHKLMKKFSVGWREFLSNISDEWELNTWEENDANIMATTMLPYIRMEGCHVSPLTVSP